MCAYHRSDTRVRAPNHFQNSLSWGKQKRFTLTKLHAELELGSGSVGREGELGPPSILWKQRITAQERLGISVATTGDGLELGDAYQLERAKSSRNGKSMMLKSH